MCIIQKKVEIKITKRNINWFLNKKYDCTSETTLLIDVDDLQIGSSVMIDCECDYCGIHFKRVYSKVLKGHSSIKKDTCAKKECLSKKTKEVNLFKYGVEHCSHLKEWQDKRNSTNLIKYGSIYPTQSDYVKNKTVKTNMLKYGVRYYTQSDTYKSQVEDTSIKNYGVKHYTQSDRVKHKQRETLLKHYGVDNYAKTEEYQEKMKKSCYEQYGIEYFTQVTEIKEKKMNTNLLRLGVRHPMQSSKVREKSTITMYKNGTQMCSRQQRYLADILKGELNYPVGTSSLDIAFPDEMICVEYDGGGHDLSVKLGSTTEKEFRNKETKRFYYLKSLGWKTIRIVSKKDLIPSERDLLQMIEYSKNIFDDTIRTWVKFDLDSETVETHQSKSRYHFILLSRLNGDNYENIIY